jgi:hypothetical protein
MASSLTLPLILDAVCLQQEGTPCKPMIVMLQCVKDGVLDGACFAWGLSDLMRTSNTAAWAPDARSALVVVRMDSLCLSLAPAFDPASHSPRAGGHVER